MLILTVDPVNPSPLVIARAADVLRSRGIVAYPTDTLFGLAVDPRNDSAVRRLFEAKDRDSSLAIPLIAANVEQACEAGVFGPRELRVAAAFWPGPLSIVVDAKPNISRAVLDNGTVAIRVPAHQVARALALTFGACITATSANLSGRTPAVSADDVVAAMDERIDLVIDAGDAPGGPPSTIIRIDDDVPRLVRHGAVPWERVLESLK